LGGNYVVAQIMTRGLKSLGYDVKLSTMNMTLFFPAVAQGDVDISSDVNMPQREPAFKPISAQAAIVGTGTIRGDGVNGYLIDKKTALAHNITTLSQFQDPKIAALFGKDGKADLISCDPGWSCARVVEYQIDKFGLKPTVREVRGKYEVLMAEAVAKVKSGQPVLFYAWSPSWVTKVLAPGVDVVWLPTPSDAMPPNMPSKGSSLVKGVEGCAGGADPCRMAMASWNWVSVANKEFLSANPAVRALVEQVNFSPATWAHWEDTISKSGGSPATVAKLTEEWMAANKPEFDKWVAAAAKAK
jgi:glycine betaine/proline transport system substrate-binding protein